MGREIRRVPPHWEHPRYTSDNARNSRDVGRFMSMADQDYETAAREWLEECDLWRAGTHKAQSGKYCSKLRFYWEYAGGPPDEDHCRPAFTAKPTWYQVYETVSEGSPVTPPFATEDELIEYLVTVGEMAGTEYNRKYSRPAAEKFVRETGWAPSMSVQMGPNGATIKEGAEALL
jgi:hypothetical protein